MITRIRRWIVIRSPEYQSVLKKLAEAEKRLATCRIIPPQGGSGTAPPPSLPKNWYVMPVTLPGTHC